MDDREPARIALACLDLTSLNDGDTAADVLRLCERAAGPPGRGAVAAVCVWPRFAALARQHLPAAVAVAAVANFPEGGSDIARALHDTHEIVAAGADEIDFVLPYNDLDAGPAMLKAVRRAVGGRVLKVILETGALADEACMARACRIALEGGADYLKTSTGRAPVGATPAAARVVLQAIARDGAHRRRVGFKAAGGIRTVADAAVYIALVAELLGTGAVHPQRLRIGASALLADIEALLAGAPAASGAPGSAAVVPY